MGITVRSPYSGRPVKIRDQDVGRAVRDEENRIFYVLPRAGGDGYYAAITRKGGQRDETRYEEMLAKQDQARDTGAQRSAAQVHDATGKGRGKRGKLVVLILLLIVLALVILFLPGYGIYGDWAELRGGTEPPPPNKIYDTNPRAPRAPADQEDADMPDEPADADPSAGPPPAAAPDDASSGFEAPTRHADTRAVVRPRIGRGGRSGALFVSDTVASAEPPDNPPAARPPDKADDRIVTTATGLRYRGIRHAYNEQSPAAKAGDYIAVHYRAYLKNGDEVESTYHDQNNPVEFVIGAGDVIAGLDEGVAGMRVGEIRRLGIPARLGYGDRGRPPRIAPHADLELDVELKRIQPGVAIAVHLSGSQAPGCAARRGDTVTIHYDAYLADGSLLDSTRTRHRPFACTLGKGEVILGLAVGLLGMTLGESRGITIPPHLAYGDRGAAGIVPPDATLRYEVDLVEIVRDGQKIEP